MSSDDRRLIAENRIHEMVIVMPDASHKYGGSYYTNSSVTGNWEDFITQDLVKYIDNTYRTLPQVASRGLAGHSMGGYGAIKLGMKHPNIYSTVYGMSSCCLVFELDRVRPAALIARSLVDMNQFREQSIFTRIEIAIAAAFAPNPENPPFFADFPFERVGGKVKVIQSVRRRYLQHDPFAMLDSHRDNLLKLQGLRFDCGRFDTLIPQNRAFSEKLTDAGVRHVFEEFDGGHSDRLRERLETKMLPFFSDVLAFEILPEVSVWPRGKLATTWGAIKFMNDEH